MLACGVKKFARQKQTPPVNSSRLGNDEGTSRDSLKGSRIPAVANLSTLCDASVLFQQVKAGSSQRIQ
jgi:hypothetical protein